MPHYHNAHGQSEATKPGMWILLALATSLLGFAIFKLIASMPSEPSEYEVPPVPVLVLGGIFALFLLRRLIEKNITSIFFLICCSGAGFFAWSYSQKPDPVSLGAIVFCTLASIPYGICVAITGLQVREVNEPKTGS